MNKNQPQISSIEVLENKDISTKGESSLFSEFHTYPHQMNNLKVNSDNFINHPVLPDIMQSKRNFKDIPSQFVKKIAHPLPYQGLIIDSGTGKEFTQALRYSREIPESQKDQLVQKINTYFPQDPQRERAVVTLCVRSAWDLYLQVREFPRGSEIVFTGVNIADMIKITEMYGIVPVPVDLAVDTMMPSLEDIQKAVTPKTKAIIFAYVYGITYDLSRYMPFLNSTDIEVIEDAAQSFQSVQTFRGSPHALMTMFSFGSIKHNTAFFGAVTNVRQDQDKHPGNIPLSEAMENIQNKYVLYTPEQYRKKIWQTRVISFVAQNTMAVEFSTRLYKLLGLDGEEIQIQFIRGFAPTDDENYLKKFRVKPCAPLIRMIIERTINYTALDHANKQQNYKKMQEALVKNGFFVPGQAHGTKRSYWLFPLVVSNKLQYRDFMQAQGVFCYKTATQVGPVPMPDHKKAELGELTQMNNFFENQVYLPVHNMVPKKQMDIIVDRVVKISHRYNSYLINSKNTTEFKKWPQSKLLAKL